MKNKLLMLMATVAVFAASPVCAMETPEEASLSATPTRTEKIWSLEAEKQVFSAAFDKLAAVRFQNGENPDAAFEMRDLEEKIWRHTSQILNLTLQMDPKDWPKSESKLRAEQASARGASYCAEHPRGIHYAGVKGGGLKVVYCDYYSVLLHDHVWGTSPNYSPLLGRFKN